MSTVPASDTDPEAPQESAALRGAMKSFAAIERIGNVLPHPFGLFLILAAFVMVLSAILNIAGVHIINPSTGKEMVIQSLLTTAGVKEIFGNGVTAYATFAPLATILITMMGIAVAQRGGLIDAVLRSFVTKVPAAFLTFALAFTAMIGHVAGDSAYVVLIPLGALVFQAAGRSPILGAIVAFVSISAGYDASPSITTTDVLLSGITTAAAHTIDKTVTVTPLSNYFFGLASSIVVSTVITLVVERIMVKRHDLQVDADYVAPDNHSLESMQLTPAERRGLTAAGITALIFFALIAAALIPSHSPFRGDGGSVTKSPLLTGMAIVLWAFFTLVGIAYAFTAKTMTKAGEIITAMAKGVADMAPILVLFFAISQFLDYFKWTGMGEMLSVYGARELERSGLPLWLILLGICILISILNFIITSGSAMWSLVGPIFVPMLMLLHVPAATTQALYRIADSVTNCVTPMSPYFVMALGYVQQWRKKAGIGTLASFTIPIAGAVWVVWVIFFFLWYALKLPFGL